MKTSLTLTKSLKLKNRFRLSIRYVQYTQIVLNILITSEAAAITKTSIASGNWDNAACWSPAGKPSANDDVTISNLHIITLTTDEKITSVTVAGGATLIGPAGSQLDIYGDLTVYGNVDMNGGNIDLKNSGSAFNIGGHGNFIWSPRDNTSQAATLFTNGVENFNPSSTLIIKRWYDYTVAIGELVTGNFGNLTINSPGGTNSIVEWNQKNQFENHKVIGTLTIDQGWVTLDKSGSISSTTIGKIVLTSINSTFICHSGTHPSSFTLNTSSVTNNGGKFYGLNDGNGNVNIKVAGNFLNSGNVKILNNSGVSGVSNGDADFRVDGDFTQTSGDTRIIYNISSLNSGTFTATIRNLNLNGGIFMGQSACHTGGQINTLNVTQDFSVNFSNAADKFRGSGITSIGPATNNAGFALIVGRNLTISGTTQAEFTSTAAAGDELINVHGDATFRGCTSSFNYGNPSAAHSTEFQVQGNFIVDGGACCLSRNNGTLHSVINKDISIVNGTLVLKANSGSASVTVNGSFKQSGGTTFFHSNNTTPAANSIQLEVLSTFRHSGGTINFDDNASGAEHILSLKGDSCFLSGNGIITHAGAGTSNISGQINFDKAGKIFIQRQGNSHVIDQVIQTVGSACELVAKNCNIKIASHSSPSYNSFKVRPGGKLTLSNASLVSNGLHSNTCLYVDSSSVVTITNDKGLCGSSQSAFGSSLKFFLHSKSIVEYRGAKSNAITGLTTLNNQPQNKYGILRIVLDDAKYSVKLGDQVFVRTKLELIKGNLKLNNHTLTIENGNSDAIKRVSGFIDSDIDDSQGQNLICWKGITTGIHEFPFGRSSNTYLPVRFNVITGAGNNVSISTRRTLTDNLPYPPNTTPLSNTPSFDESNAVDRWWTITAPGVKADITFTYSGDENSLLPDFAKESLYAMQWTGSSWTKLPSPSIGTTLKTGEINIRDVISPTHFVIASQEIQQIFAFNSFDAVKSGSEIWLDWDTENEDEPIVFTIEKSYDGLNFFEIGTLLNDPAVEGAKNYNFSDNQLPVNISYYRIKILQNNNTTSYSEMKSVNITNTNVAFVPRKYSPNSVSPNPFTSSIKIHYSAAETTRLEIIDELGRQVLSMPVDSVDAENGFTVLNLDHLKKGVYFLSIITNGRKDSMKLIKNE